MVATSLAAVHTNLRRLHENILFLTPRRSLASLASAYWYNLYSHRICPLCLGSLLHCLECLKNNVCVCVCVCVAPLHKFCVWTQIRKIKRKLGFNQSESRIKDYAFDFPDLLKTQILCNGAHYMCLCVCARACMCVCVCLFVHACVWSSMRLSIRLLIPLSRLANFTRVHPGDLVVWKVSRVKSRVKCR